MVENDNSNEPKRDNWHTFWWDVMDVAREPKCSRRTIFKLVHYDRIPYAKVGRLLRFCPARMKEWLQKGGTR